jgi:hypothetical protein
MTQWLKHAQAATVIPCFVDAAYLTSGACCKEYMIAKAMGKVLLVALDDPAVMAQVPPHGLNGDLISHFMTGGQCLLASPGQKYHEPAALAAVIAEKMQPPGVTTTMAQEPGPE